jgi:glycosyltransferase involved in cell wall biosynthesis
MRAALDATPLTVPTGGIARYTAELSRALADLYPDDQYWLVSDQAFQVAGGPPPPNLQMGLPPTGFVNRRWWFWGLRKELMRLGADVFHGTDFAVPYFPDRPSVMTVHDLSPWRNPDWQPQAGRIRRRTPLLLKRNRATMVITPSEAIRREVIDRFGIDGVQVVATPLAASFRTRPLVRGKYFLFVGTLEPRKNLPTLVKAFREVNAQTGLELVIAGRRRPDYRSFKPQPGVRFTGPVSEAELEKLYFGAMAFVYPSLYEGFGLPVLEAMQVGIPVITSTDPAITEVAAGAAIQVQPRDVRGWVEGMLAIARSPERATELRDLGLKRAREFSWQRTAALTRDVYEEARRRFRRSK